MVKYEASRLKGRFDSIGNLPPRRKKNRGTLLKPDQVLSLARGGSEKGEGYPNCRGRTPYLRSFQSPGEYLSPDKAHGDFIHALGKALLAPVMSTDSEDRSDPLKRDRV